MHTERVIHSIIEFSSMLGLGYSVMQCIQYFDIEFSIT
jgi:hypothetical protein